MLDTSLAMTVTTQTTSIQDLRYQIVNGVSSHFPNAGIEEVRMSVDFYWKDIKSACENSAIASPSFVWTPKRLFENDEIPILSRGEFDLIDGGSGMLVLTIDAMRLQEDVHASHQDCLQCTLIPTDGPSMVGERLPPELSDSVIYSSENCNHVWESIVPAWTTCRHDPEKCVDMLAALMDNVDSVRKICSLVNGLLIEMGKMANPSLDMHSGEANDTLVEIQSLIIHARSMIRVLRTISASCSGLNEGSVESWSESWCSIMRDSLKIASVYKGGGASNLLIQILTSFSYMIVKPIPAFYPQHEKLWQVSADAEDQLALCGEIESSLSDIQIHMSEFLKLETAYEVDRNLIQAALLPVDCLRARCQLICNLLYYKRRYHCFCKFKSSIKAVEAVSEQFEAIFRMGAQIKTHALLYEQGVEPACLQEMMVLLHRAEIDATKAISGHIVSLKSHRRCYFLSRSIFDENASLEVKVTQEDLMDRVCSKGWASIEVMCRNIIQERDTLFPIKGVGSLISALLRLKCVSGIVAHLVPLCSGKLSSDKANRLNEIKDTEHRWAQDSIPILFRHIKSIDDPLLVKLNEGQYEIQLQKEVWRCLIGLFHLHKFGWADKQFERYLSLHFHIIHRYHLMKYLKFIQDVRLVQVSSYLPDIASDISNRILQLESMGASLVTWSCASMEQFLQKFQEVTKILTNIWFVTRNADKVIDNLGDKILNCFRERDACCVWESTLEQTTGQICTSIQLDISACKDHIKDSEESVRAFLERHTCSNTILHDSIESYTDCLKSKFSVALYDSYSYVVKLWLESMFGQGANQFNQKKPDKIYFVIKGVHGTTASQYIYDSISQSITYCLSNIRSTLLSFLDRDCSARFENITSEYANTVLKNLQKNMRDIDDKLAEYAPNGSPNSLDKISYFDLESIQRGGRRTHDILAEVHLYQSLYLKKTFFNEQANEKDASGISSELVRRCVGLDCIVSKLESNCMDLHGEIQSAISCPEYYLVPKVSTIHSDYFEQIWALESSIKDVQYEYGLLKRLDPKSTHKLQKRIENLVLLLSSIERLMAHLTDKIQQAENSIWEDMSSLEKSASQASQKFQWMDNPRVLTIKSLEDEMCSLGLDLSACIAEAEDGSNLSGQIQHLSSLFTGHKYPSWDLDSYASSFKSMNNILKPYKEICLITEAIRSASWCEYCEKKAEFSNQIRKHLDDIERAGKPLQDWMIFKECSEFTYSILEYDEILSGIGSSPLEARHWQKLESIVGLKGLASGQFALSYLWSESLVSKRSEVEDLVLLVQRESKLKNAFQGIKEQWLATKITLTSHKQRGQILLDPNPTSEIMESLEESIMNLNNMISNRASYYFREEVLSLSKCLSNIEECMQLWLSTQSVWNYMESVFDSDDISSQLPLEASMFQEIDREYLCIASEAFNVLLILQIFKEDRVKENLERLLGRLELCQKSLTAYLEAKRKLFPRFYFVSDSTLLEILSNGSNPRAVQKHFQSGLFDGLDQVQFKSQESNIITHIVSKEGEVVELKSPIEATGAAESWLQSLVDSMQETMRIEARRCARDVNKIPLNEFLFNRPAQMALLGLQIKWTSDVQSALLHMSSGKKNALKKTLDTYNKMLSELVGLTLMSSLSIIQRTCLETCVTVFIHQKDAIEELIQKKVEDPKSFHWLKHCRFRWREDRNSLFISICDNEFEYGFEYLGVKERLVMTPLTDICYVGLTQAVGMHCGGAPAGPAGTGKTETTKDLGANLGRYVVVFNCSDQMDHHMMGRIFKGLAQSGFWGCFDEFNRINLDVLSVCAQQLGCVFSALKDRKRKLIFSDGDTIELNPAVGYFITMNPGYAGRQELPENLKALFRGVTMMAPERRTIMKVKLAAAGFQESEILSRKFDRLYTLCEQQLSKQPHYDFGLRNILSVLRSAGAAKRANPDMTEMSLIVKTLNDMNASKLVSEDVETFSGLMSDVFPPMGDSNDSTKAFLDILNEICTEDHLEFLPSWTEKCLQLYESSIVRHGLMVVGPPKSGKSSIVDAVSKALCRMGTKTHVWRMNPKSITAPQMFGKLDHSTGDWTDGIFSMLWKRAAKAAHSVWIVVDGPVDAVWIENLNTVLDDNKVLTLANGDRLRMLSSMRLVFETENLDNASPATVSRAGVVYMSPSVVGWKPMLSSFLKSRGIQSVKLQGWIESMISAAARSASACTSMHMPDEIILTQNFMTLLDGHFSLFPKSRDLFVNLNCENKFDGGILGVTLFCLVWGFSGSLPKQDRSVFTNAFREQANGLCSFPDIQMIYDMYFDIDAAKWRPWNHVLDALDPDEERRESDEFFAASVHTTEGTRMTFLLNLIHAAGKTPHIIGPAKSGKSTILRQFCRQQDTRGMSVGNIAFSAVTTPQMFQRNFEQYLEKRQGRTYGPLGGKQMMMVVDDISLAKRNEWGDQETNELLRQLLEMNGFYRSDKPIGEFKSIVDVKYVIVSRVGQGLSIPNRLSGNLTSLYVDIPSDLQVKDITIKLINSFIQRHSIGDEDSAFLRDIGQGTINICQRLARKFDKASPSTLHYHFGLASVCSILKSTLTKLCLRNATFAKEIVILLWRHECERELVDQITHEDDVGAALLLINDESLKVRSQLFPGFIRDLYACDNLSQINYYTPEVQEEQLCFSSIMSGQSGENREYEFIEGGLKSVKIKIESILDNTRQKNGSSFVLYDEAVHHLVKISRVLNMEGRSVMMIGVGGIGKKSITKVSAMVAGCHLVHNVKGQGYSLGAYLEDLRLGFKKCGIRGDSVCFMLSDEDISDDLFLDYANQYLVTGRVTGIFEKDDLESILVEVRPIWKEIRRGSNDSDEKILDFFWKRVTQKFHFAFCFSPSSGRLTKWMKQFPGLLSSCTIDWFHPWPVNALETVARNQLSSIMQKSKSYSTSSTLPEATSRIHELMQSLSNEYFKESGRHVHVTPKSYLCFIQAIHDLYENKLIVLESEARSLKQGLTKMASAKEQVDMMKEELHVKQNILSDSHANIATLINEVNQSKAEANLERKKVQDIVSVVTEKAREIYEVKVEAEKELDAAKPALEAALEALNSITSKDIGSLKSLRKPPDVIKRIMDCVLLLRHMPVSKVSWHDIKDTVVIQSSYDESLKMMGEMGFLQNLLNFPKDEINDETVELLQPYFKSPDFSYSSAKKASGNVAGLCNWAESMCKYHQIARYVEPKIVRLNESQKELMAATAEQEIAQEELQKVESSLTILQKKYDNANQEMQRIQNDANVTSLKMKNALTLIESLGGEEMRWKQLYNKTEASLRSLLGDCILACTFVSYFGPFDISSREKYMKECLILCEALGIRSSECFDPVNFLADRSEILGWHEQGLPTDEFSVQNGVIFSASSRFVYIIDPQGQGIQWLGRKYTDSMSVPISSKSFNQVLEGCIVDGRPLLIQNVDGNFGSSLDSLLQNDSDETIRLNDKELEMKEGFQAILCTRLSSPELSPENYAKCTVLNFSVTFNGLEDQFLDFILSKDESTLHKKRNTLDEDVRRCQNKMRQLELDLLQRLSSYDGDILEDTHLISVLADTKQTSQWVAQQLKNAKETKDSISAKCEMYRPIARIATLLYFGLKDFTSINHMYTTSLEQFKDWFADSIEAAEKSTDIAQRVRNIINELKSTVYQRAQRGMFERDKQSFRFVLASKCLEDQDQTFAFDLRKALLCMGKNPVKARRRVKEWLSEDQWRNILHLSQHAGHNFVNLISSFSSQEPKWKSWIRSETPETIPYPGSDEIIPTAQLCIIRALRPERTKYAINIFVEAVLGREFLISKPADLAKLSSITTSKTPIICIISPGADPTNKIHEVARKSKIKCHNISMGQGQEIIARQHLNVAQERGEWVCIQNAHLAGGFLQELEEMIDSLGMCDDNFKIWITTEPSDAFPMGLLHRGTRVTCEPPSGIRDAMVSLMSSMDPDTLEEVKLPHWKYLLISLSIMHIICQERRKFGPMGWIVPYEFSNSDLLASMNVVASHLQDLRGKRDVAIDWESLRFLIGGIQYGGRIIDERDQGLMMAYCRRFISDAALNGQIILYDGRKVPGVMRCYNFQVGQEATLEDLIQSAKDLPAHDMPEIFGLERSAEVSSQMIESEECIQSISSILNLSKDPQVYPSKEGGDQLRETLDAFLEYVNSLKDFGKLLSSTKCDLQGPLRTFYSCEVDSICFILRTVTQDLQLLHDASLTDTQEPSMLSLGYIPKRWSKLFPKGGSSIDLWIKNFKQCVENLISSVERYKGRCVCVSSLSHPRALLNSILQEGVRSNRDRKGFKIDDLDLSYQVTKIMDPKSLKEAPREGLYIFGFTLEGGAWDMQSGKLVQGRGIGESPFPIIHVTAVPKMSVTRRKNSCRIPLYISKDRKSGSFLDYIPLPIVGDEDDWAQRGTSLVCK